LALVRLKGGPDRLPNNQESPPCPVFVPGHVPGPTSQNARHYWFVPLSRVQEGVRLCPLHLIRILVMFHELTVAEVATPMSDP